MKGMHGGVVTLRPKGHGIHRSLTGRALLLHF